jgi:oxygen-independent coproporphyrinogen-3 oxidase
MDSTVGVYVHVPFCSRICPYCDFAVVPAPELLRGANAEFRLRETRYVDAILRELERRAPTFAGRTLATIYFGGGTPALFGADSLARIRAAIVSRFEPAGIAIETTLEVNPSTVERDRLPAFRHQAGIDRLSIGVQSFDDHLLKALGRAHRAEECHLTLAAARAAGFDNISLDLLFAALHQTAESLQGDLDTALAFGPEHISTYELVHEPRTPFGRAVAAGRLATCPEDTAADMLERIETVLVRAGFERYELTNFAQPGRASRHNQRYWARLPVLALGVGAHSTDPPTPTRPHGARLANPRALNDWLGRVERGQDAFESEEILDARAARSEACFLSLRRSAGLCAAEFAAEFSAPPRHFFAAGIDRLLARGLLVEAATGDLALTASGRMLADDALSEFV